MNPNWFVQTHMLGAGKITIKGKGSSTQDIVIIINLFATPLLTPYVERENSK